MKKKTIIISAICISAYLPICTSAQNIGINATGSTPDNSAMLDVSSTSSGMLIPRMTGAQKYAIATPATGLLIFQTDTVGFWYYDGSKWIPLVASVSSTSSPSNAGWLTTGNIGTNANNFLGTTDNVSLRMRTNNAERMIVDSGGNVGIGGASKWNAKFTVNGNFTTLGRGNTASVYGYSPSLELIDSTATQNWYMGIDNEDGKKFCIGMGYGTHQAYNPGTGSRNMVIDVSGNVGIGTTSPITSLHLYKDYSFASAGTLYSQTPFPGQLILGDNSQRLYLGAFYSSGIYSGSAIQSSDFWSGTDHGQPLLLNPNGGNIGIGTATLYAKLHVKQGTSDVVGIRISRDQAEGNPMLQFSDDVTYNNNIQLIAGTNNLAIAPTFGNVGIGTAVPGQKLDIAGGNGRVQSGFSWLTNSDVRYKTNITTLTNSLEKVLAIRGVRYDLKNDISVIAGKGKYIGYIAQELEKEFPEFVVTGQDGYKSVAYDKMTAVLVEAMKEQQKMIYDLKAAVNLLLQQNNKEKAKK